MEQIFECTLYILSPEVFEIFLIEQFTIQVYYTNQQPK